MAVLAFWCAQRWNTWFGNPAEPAYASLAQPARIQLTFGNAGERSRNITWQCGSRLLPAGIAYFEKGKNDTLRVPAEGRVLHTAGGTTVVYRAALNDLTAGEYRYAVRAGEGQSAWYDFTVAGNGDFSFIYLGDIQDTVGGVMRHFVDSIRHWQPPADFWLLGGDVVERPHDRYWNEY